MTDARTTAPVIVKSAARVLDVLDLLFRADYMRGMSPTEIGDELSITPASMTRYLATLRNRGAIEPVTHGDHTYYRPAVRWGQYANGVLGSLDDHSRRASELRRRIQTPIN
jgi:DNA-binding IclR family transcriptional regulator